MRLVGIVIRILPQNHDTHFRQRRQFESTIDVFGSGKYTVFSALRLNECLQFREIHFRKLIPCHCSPTGREIPGNVRNVSQGKLSAQTI